MDSPYPPFRASSGYAYEPASSTDHLASPSSPPSSHAHHRQHQHQSYTAPMPADEEDDYGYGERAPRSGRRDEEAAYASSAHAYDQGQTFDPAADFNNVGPRWVPHPPTGPSTSFVPPSASPSNPEAGKKDPFASELVTVPALGAEWKDDELAAMTKRGKREEKTWEARQKRKAWLRDERKLCGFVGRRALVFAVFGFLVALGVTLYFVIPRAPTFDYANAPLSVSDDGQSAYFQRQPTANFSFDATLSLELDTSSSWIPVHFTSFQLDIYDSATSKKIGTGGRNSSFSVPGRTGAHHVDVPVTFAYSAVNDSDTTWLDIYNSCKHIWPGQNATQFSLKTFLKMKISGLGGEKETQKTTTNLDCPFELPKNSA